MIRPLIILYLTAMSSLHLATVHADEQDDSISDSKSKHLQVQETAVHAIPLAPPLNDPEAEISGLSWCGDRLILLTQYPERFVDDGNSYFYFLKRNQVLGFLDGTVDTALEAQKIKLNEHGLRQMMDNFDGYEAITCKDNHVWLTIEAVNTNGRYQSFIVPGEIDFDGKPTLSINSKKLTQLESQTNMKDMAEETLVLLGDDAIAIHEANDPRFVPEPKAKLVSRTDMTVSDISFPHMPYRITDATDLDLNGRFWVINYKYSGDEFSRQTDDPLSKQYGKGASHQKYYNVERLIELRLNGNTITREDRAPIPLLMTAVEGRNWEGIVRLGNRGFLIATDKHPSTMLGFVPMAKK